MPFVHVELIKGRSDEQLTQMMKDITEAVHKNTGAPKEHIHVIINELLISIPMVKAANGELKTKTRD